MDSICHFSLCFSLYVGTCYNNCVYTLHNISNTLQVLLENFPLQHFRQKKIKLETCTSSDFKAE
jgi:hypothetical protein